DFKTAYLTNELKQANSFLLENFESKNDSMKKLVDSRFRLLIDNLKDESFIPTSQKIDFNKLQTLKDYTKNIGHAIDMYLDEYKKHYQKIYNENVDLVEKKITFIEQRGENINDLKNRYYNESLADLVKNVNAKQRIVEYDGKLIQQINPIFQNPRPLQVTDYRTAFFLPVKNLLGTTISTYWFNMVVIWFMTLFFYLFLYFEWLRRFIEASGKIKFFR
ncbi:MAG: ABC transporter, partial [Flammeovirgaceae bacterium]